MVKIGWIGTGKMGQRMSKHLMDGNEVYVYDVMPANAQPLVKLGAKLLGSPAQIAEHADVIFTMIPSSKVLLDIMVGENGILKSMKPGTIISDSSTIEPSGSIKVNKNIEEAGGIFLRSPVSGSTENADKAELALMCSGNKAAYEKVLPLFERMTNRQYYLGSGEEARYMKIAVNMMVGNIAQMLAESLVLGEKVGLDWNTMLDVFGDCSATSPIIKFKVDALKKRDFSPMGTVTILEKDMGIALEIADKNRIALPITAISKQFLNALVGSGRQDLDYSAVILLNEELNGIVRK